MTKTCSKCKKEKSTKDFPKDRTRKSGFGSWCRCCKNSYCRIYYHTGGKIKSHLRNKKWRKTPLGKLRDRRYKLKKKYGLSVSQYQEMLKKQNGVCAVCGKSESVKQNHKVRLLAVDHDHTTGSVRGLLCQRCNLILGHIGNNPNLLDEIRFYISISERRQSIIDAASAALRRNKK